MKIPFRQLAPGAVLVVAAALSACGGGGGSSNPPATSEVPNSASQSVGGFIAYLRDLVASSADQLEPVDISGVTPPTTDTAEPEAVN